MAEDTTTAIGTADEIWGQLKSEPKIPTAEDVWSAFQQVKKQRKAFYDQWNIDPETRRQRSAEVVDISKDLFAPVDTVVNNYSFLTADPQDLREEVFKQYEKEPGVLDTLFAKPLPDGTIELSPNIEGIPAKPQEDELLPGPMEFKDEGFAKNYWKNLKQLFVAEGPAYVDDSRMAKFDEMFNTVVGQPLRFGLKLAKGMTFGTPDMAWAGLKRALPEDQWNEVKDMNLDEAMDWAAGYNPSAFNSMLGDIAQFSGAIGSASKLIPTPEGLSTIGKAAHSALQFGAARTATEGAKLASEKIDPTEADYGYEGATAVMKDMALGAIFSFAKSGGEALWNRHLMEAERVRVLELLGLEGNATVPEIKEAARRFMKINRPNASGDIQNAFSDAITKRIRMLRGESTDIVFRGAKVKVNAPKPLLPPFEQEVAERVMVEAEELTRNALVNRHIAQYQGYQRNPSEAMLNKIMETRKHIDAVDRVTDPLDGRPFVPPEIEALELQRKYKDVPAVADTMKLPTVDAGTAGIGKPAQGFQKVQTAATGKKAIRNKEGRTADQMKADTPTSEIALSPKEQELKFREWKERKRYDTLLQRVEQGNMNALQQLKAFVSGTNLPTYEDLLARATEGDEQAVQDIIEGRYFHTTVDDPKILEYIKQGKRINPLKRLPWDTVKEPKVEARKDVDRGISGDGKGKAISVPPAEGTIRGYHGTWKEFPIEKFNRKQQEKNRIEGAVDTMGIWFSSTKEGAGAYGPITVEADLSINKPYRFKGKGAWKTMSYAADRAGGGEAYRNKLISEGYDGISIKGDTVDGVEQDVYIAFEPSQIKKPGQLTRFQRGMTPLIPMMAEELKELGTKGVTNSIDFARASSEIAQNLLQKGVTRFRTMGPGGEQIADDIEYISFKVEQNSNVDTLGVADAYKGMSKAQREMIGKWANERLDKAPPKAIQDAEKALNEIMDRAMEEAAELGMKRVIYTPKRTPGGIERVKEVVPVGGSGRWYPQIPNKAGEKFLNAAEKKGKSDPKVFQWAEAQVVDGKFKTVDDAVTALQDFRNNQLRGVNGYLEKSRVDLPEEYIEWDGLKTLPHLIRKNWSTVEGVRKWGYDAEGRSFPGANKLLEQIRTDKGSTHEANVREFIRSNFGLGSNANLAEKKLSDIVRGYQFTTKVSMSPLTIARNMLDRIAKGYMISPVATIQAMKDYPPFLNAFIESARLLEREMIERGAVFGHGSLSEGYEPGSVASELAAAPFTTSERGNQAFIALVSYRKLMADIANLHKQSPRLWKILTGNTERAIKERLKPLGEKTLAKIESGEQLTQEEISWFLHQAVRDKAFPKIASTKEAWYDSHPLRKIFMQFKTWSARQTAMLYNDVLKYTAKTGDPTRIINYLVGIFVAGELYNILRDTVKDRNESVYSQLKLSKEERKIGRAILKDLVDGGLVGMLADFTYGIFDWGIGPTGSTAKEGLKTASRIIKEFDLKGEVVGELAKKELTPIQQIESVMKKFDKDSMYTDYSKWRSRAWEFANDAKTPEEKLYAWTDRALFGRNRINPGEHSMAYEMINRQIIAGDIDDAAEYVSLLVSRADTPEELMKIRTGLKSSMTRRGPLGGLGKERGNFLGKLTTEERTEVLDLERDYREAYKAAINRGWK